MKSLISKLNNLKSEIVGIEMILSVCDEDLIEINKNLVYLHAFQDELIYNLKFLRQDNIVAIMKSYNQSVVQLKEVQRRIIKNRHLRGQVFDKKERLGKNIQNIMIEIKQTESIVDNDAKILLFRKAE